MSEKYVTQEEAVLLQRAIIFVVVLAVIVQIIPETIATFPFFIQFLVVTVPFYFLLDALIGRFGRSVEGFLSRKFLGILFLIASVDLISPAYLVTREGVLVTENVFSTATIDALFYNIYSFFGITGLALHVLVYYVSFVVLLLIAVILLDYRELLRVKPW